MDENAMDRRLKQKDQKKLDWSASKEQREANTKKAQEGFMKAAQDNPISKAVKWFSGSKS